MSSEHPVALNGPDERSAGEVARTARVVVLVGTILLLAGTGLILWARSGFAVPPQTFMRGPAAMLALTTAVIAQTSGGIILAVRRPTNMVGWLILLFSVAISLAILVDGYLALVETGWAAPVDPAFVALLPGLLVFTLGSYTAIALGMVFPDGHVLASRSRSFLAVAAFGALFFALGVAGTPGPLLAFPTYDNPLPVPGGTIWPTLLRVFVGPGLLVLGVIGTSVALLQRYRAAGPTGRLQLRWYVTGAVVLSIGFTLYIVALLSLPPDSPWGELITTSFYFAAAYPPIAMVFAILRYHLFDIDLIIGRALVYGALTAILAGIYTASIRLFNAVFVALTGEASEVALVITTLILATTFTPIKGRLEGFVAARIGGDAPGTAEPQAVALLDDPRFQAALDERIRVALTDASVRSVAVEEDRPPAG